MNSRFSLLKQYRLVVLLGFILQTTQIIAAADKPIDATPAPSWSLTDLDGKPSSLASYKGKVVILNFWGTFCTPCRKEIPEFVSIQQQFAHNGVVVVGAAMDKNDDATVKAFTKKFFVNYPIVIAPNALTQAYGIIGAPTTFIIDKNGFIAHKHVGTLSRKDLAEQIMPLL